MRHADLRAYLEMAQDTTRVRAYKAAIETLCPDKIVLDLGAGPGILSHLALAAGAKKVYAIDSDPHALAMAATVAVEMGASDRFVPITKRSRDVTRADLRGELAEVLVTETMDVLGTGEGICESTFDLVRRLCVRGAAICPRKLDVSLALGTSVDLVAMASEWGKIGGWLGLPYEKIIATMPTVALSASVEDRLRFTEWVDWQSIKIGHDDSRRRTLVPFTATRDGIVEAILVAWRAELCDGVSLSTFPADPLTHWKQGVVTIGGFLPVVAGRRYALEMVFSSPTKFGFAISDTAELVDPRVGMAFDAGKAIEIVG